MLITACRKAPPVESPPDKPRAEEIAVLLNQGRIEIVTEPGRVCLDRDLLLTIRVTAPSNWSVNLPPLGDRCQGFTVSGDYEKERRAAGTMVIRERCLRLTPLPGAEYRLAPMAAGIEINGSKTWVATTPVRFDVAPLLAKGGGQVGRLKGPVWIRPGPGTVILYLAVFLLVAAIVFLVWKLGRHVQREIRLRRMSPRERALHELSELIARDLVGHDQVKEFYFELTMIVRRYIERAHAIRAPEQTTEEFLDAASRDPRFTREVVNRLRAFLQAADLVKYAAFRPDKPVVDGALDSAKTYVETDAAGTGAPDQGGS